MRRAGHLPNQSYQYSQSLESECELKYSAIEAAAEATLVRILPLTIHNLKSDVFVGRAGFEYQRTDVFVLFVFDDIEGGSLRFVDLGGNHLDVHPAGE